MGSKKKIAQEARREVRLRMRKFGETFSERLSIFNKALRPRPKWIPRSVWRKLTNIFIDIESIEKAFYGEK